MSGEEILTRLALSLAIGFLIGVERGWRERDAGEGERTAGLRTFALIGIAGGIFGLLGQSLGVAAFAVGFLAVAGAIMLFRWRESQHEGGFGATTLVAAFLTFGLGAYAVAGDMVGAAAATVATAAILAAKGWLHAWLRTLTWEELRSALILFAMTFVVLPVLPDRGFGPYEALNPRSLWLMTIAIAGVSFIGYVAVKIAGTRYGPLIAGIAGGVVSSTITTVDMARRASAAPKQEPAYLAGAVAASATMFVRVAVIVAVFGAELLPRVAGSLAAALAVSVAAALVVDRPWRGSKGAEGESRLTNPFELRTVLLFGAMLAAVMLLSTAASETFGEGGGVLFAAVAGIGDVDAITLSMTQVAGGAVSQSAAAIAILVAVAANSASKTVLATAAGVAAGSASPTVRSAWVRLPPALSSHWRSPGPPDFIRRFRMHLAQINVGRPLYPLDDPRIAEFIDNLDAVNALAEQSPGFVWRLKDDSGNATHISAYEDPTIIVNMSVWETPEALYDFAYKTMHRSFVQRRKEWFELFGAQYLALWWVAEGHRPEIGEGQRRLAHLERFGPTAWAFNFRRPFPPTAGAQALGDVGDGRAAPEAYRLCG